MIIICKWQEEGGYNGWQITIWQGLCILDSDKHFTDREDA
jgi:hypothetical protein